MGTEQLVRIDAHALRERVTELGWKQWLLAEQLGVHRKTVGRWLSGKVRRIARSRAEALAALLECEAGRLLAEDEREPLATPAEQVEAARLIQTHDLLRVVSPGDDWPLAEGLLKATMRPNLPASELGRLYNFLSIACWRQARFEEGERHARKALDLARRTGARGVELKALLNIATVAEQFGRNVEAKRCYDACLEHADQLESPGDRGIALSNLSMVCRNRAEFDDGIALQRQAIALWQALRLPFNLSISWWMLSLVFTEIDRLEDASAAIDACEREARQVGYSKMLRLTPFQRAEIASLDGHTEQGVQLLEPALDAVWSMAQYDYACHEIATRVHRRAGRVETARRQLEHGLHTCAKYPYYKAQLLLERARIAQAEGDEALECASRFSANGLFASMELDKRVRTGAVVEYHRMFGHGA